MPQDAEQKASDSAMSDDSLNDAPEKYILLSQAFDAPFTPSPNVAVVAEEDQKLRDTLVRYISNDKSGNVKEFEQFLESHPKSRWAPSLQLNLGLLYRQNFQLEQAIKNYQELLEKQESPSQVIERGYVAYVELLSRLGDAVELKKVLEAKNRPLLDGPFQRRVELATQALASMQAMPTEAFTCGQQALAVIAEAKGKNGDAFRDAKAGLNGSSLWDLAELARAQGQQYLILKRSHADDLELPVPSVVHFRANHFSAIVGSQVIGKDIFYDVRDAGFGNRFVEARALLSELDGYLLTAPSEKISNNTYSQVSESEARGVMGKGFTAGFDRNAYAANDRMGSCGGNRGFGRAGFHTMLGSVWIADQPLSYEPARGDPLNLEVVHNDAEYMYNTQTPNFGGSFTFNWLSYVEPGRLRDNPVNVYLRGGGVEEYEGWGSGQAPAGVSTCSACRWSRPNANSGAQMLQYADANRYARYESDGSYEVFSVRTPRAGTNGRIYLSERVNRQGLSIGLSYNAETRLQSILDASGQRTTFIYEGNENPTTDSYWRIVSIQDPYGRAARFRYQVADPAPVSGTRTLYINGRPVAPASITEQSGPHFNKVRLSSIEDVGGIQTKFIYACGWPNAAEDTPPENYVSLSTSSGSFANTYYRRCDAPPQNSSNVLFPPVCSPAVEQLPNFAMDRCASENPHQIVGITTPYGSTQIRRGVMQGFISSPGGVNQPIDSPWSELIDPEGGVQRIEARRAPVTGIAAEDPNPPVTTSALTARNLNVRNSLYWSPKAIADDPERSVENATIYHFNHSVDGRNTSGLIESIKAPQESRVYFSYLGQDRPSFVSIGMKPWPTTIARVLDDNSTQAYRFTYAYNQGGNAFVMTSADPVGRRTIYEFSQNEYDLTRVLQAAPTGEPVVMANIAYTNNSLPHLITDGNGATTNISYNNTLPTSVTNAAGQAFHFEYNPAGELVSSTAPNGLLTRYEYHLGFVSRISNQEGAGSFERNAFGMPTRILNETTGAEQLIRYRAFTPAAIRDALGAWSILQSNGRGQITRVVDPVGGVTNYTYDTCGKVNRMSDGGGRVTEWTYDVKGRLRTEQAGNFLKQFTYENTNNRLRQTIDANGETTQYQYEPDNRIRQTVHSNGYGKHFEYHPTWAKLSSIGFTGEAAYRFDYGRTGNLERIDGPQANDTLSFSTDIAGRLSSWTFDAEGSHPLFAQYGYDAQGRVNSEKNTLGKFNYTYESPRGPLTQMSTPLGLNLHLEYDKRGDFNRLFYATGAGQRLMERGYSFDLNGRITDITNAEHLTSNRVASTPKDTTPEKVSPPDDKNEEVKDKDLKDVTLQDQSIAPSIVTQPQVVRQVNRKLAYDQAGRLTQSTQVDPATNRALSTTSFEYDLSQNRRRILKDEGEMWRADYDSTNTLSQVVTPYGVFHYSYDSAGSMTSKENQSYSYNGQNRLIEIRYDTSGSNRTNISYDVLGKIQRIDETTHGNLTSATCFVWNGTTLLEERDCLTPGSQARQRYLPQGMIENGTASLLLRDLQGSVVARTDQTGAITAERDYDVWGNITYSSGDVGALSYSNYFNHERSGLYLTPFRAYDPELGRWLSRDPIGMAAGPNYYAYVSNDPVNFTDPWGLQQWRGGESSYFSIGRGDRVGVFVGDVIDKNFTRFNREDMAAFYPTGSFVDISQSSTNQGFANVDTLFITTHGNADGPIFRPKDGEDGTVSALDFAGYLRRHGFRGSRINMVSCNVGDGAWPQELADSMGVPVAAPQSDRMSTRSSIPLPAGHNPGNATMEIYSSVAAGHVQTFHPSLIATMPWGYLRSR